MRRPAARSTASPRTASGRSTPTRAATRPSATNTTCRCEVVERLAELAFGDADRRRGDHHQADQQQREHRARRSTDRARAGADGPTSVRRPSCRRRSSGELPARRRRTRRRGARSRGTCRGSRRPATAAPCRRAVPPRARAARTAVRRRFCPARSVAARRLASACLRGARASRPISTTCRTLPRKAAASGAKSAFLPSPPAISTSGPLIPSMAAMVAPTLVPFESLT